MMQQLQIREPKDLTLDHASASFGDQPAAIEAPADRHREEHTTGLVADVSQQRVSPFRQTGSTSVDACGRSTSSGWPHSCNNARQSMSSFIHSPGKAKSLLWQVVQPARAQAEINGKTETTAKSLLPDFKRPRRHDECC